MIAPDPYTTHNPLATAQLEDGDFIEIGGEWLQCDEFAWTPPADNIRDAGREADHMHAAWAERRRQIAEDRQTADDPQPRRRPRPARAYDLRHRPYRPAPPPSQWRYAKPDPGQPATANQLELLETLYSRQCAGGAKGQALPPIIRLQLRDLTRREASLRISALLASGPETPPPIPADPPPRQPASTNPVGAEHRPALDAPTNHVGATPQRRPSPDHHQAAA